MKKKVCFVATLELSVKVFLTGHMRYLQDRYDPTLIVNTANTLFLEPFDIRARVIPVKIERSISPGSDLRSLFELYGILRREKFDIVHSIMPKSGFLSMLAGLAARIPVRVHTFTGQVWKNQTGLNRAFFKLMDKVIALCATNILGDSPSQREYIIGEGVVGRQKSRVIGEGSICGVDTEKFRFDRDARVRIRAEYGFRDADTVFFYLGRMKKDKGVLDLARAFTGLCDKYSHARLLIAGPDEEDMAGKVREICAKYPDRTRILDFTDAPEKYLSAADVLCLPSYREGFGQVIAEAAATGLPSIGSRIYGIIDTINDGVTGFLFEPGSHFDLMLKMGRFLDDPSLVKSMGEEARANALRKYSKEKVVSGMFEYYRELERSP